LAKLTKKGFDMKIRAMIRALLICFVATLSLPLTLAAQQPPVPQTKWHVEKVRGPASRNFLKYYWVKGCSIYVYRHGRGLVITSTDSNFHGKALTQSIVITRDDLGIPRKVEQSSVEYNGFPLPTAGYDVFGAHHRQEAKSLPNKVKKLFFGFYLLNVQ
jgi:hypothetical protein